MVLTRHHLGTTMPSGGVHPITGLVLVYNEPETAPMGVNMKAFGHTGTGGAFAWCDRERNMAFAYCPNFQREGPGIGPRGAAVAVAAGGGKPPSWLK